VEGTEEERSGSQAWDEARAQILHAFTTGQAASVSSLPPPKEIIERQGLLEDLNLKKRYGRWLLRLVTFQLLLADVVFVVYAWAGKDWNLPSSVIYAWLSATFVELVGVVFVVTQYLFPKRGPGSSSL
jgi:hypothetical protein